MSPGRERFQRRQRREAVMRRQMLEREGWTAAEIDVYERAQAARRAEQERPTVEVPILEPAVRR
jgi:hypothetical protein